MCGEGRSGLDPGWEERGGPCGTAHLEEIHLQDEEENRKVQFIPVDVAGYVARDTEGKPVDRYAAVWVEKAADDDNARMHVAETADGEPGIPG